MATATALDEILGFGGLDVHKRTVVACVSTPDGLQTRPFGTMTGDLIGLS